MWSNLAVDHRAADGAAAGRFLTQLQAVLDGLPRELDTL
jgi:pyruvate/2-oxoglutarate dehydrogenase complex dihydrolipoamide acyltransferase (E2) component